MLTLCAAIIFLVEVFGTFQYDEALGRDATGIFNVIEHAKPSDILFLGSSITKNGINPAIVSKAIEDTTGERPSAWNLGVASSMKPDQYFILKRYLKKYPPSKLIVIDMRHSELTERKMSAASHLYPDFWSLLEISFLRRLPFESRKQFQNALARSLDYPLRSTLGDWKRINRAVQSWFPEPNEPVIPDTTYEEPPHKQGFYPILCHPLTRTQPIHKDPRCNLDLFTYYPNAVPNAHSPTPSLYESIVTKNSSISQKEYTQDDSPLVWKVILDIFGFVASATGTGPINEYYLHQIFVLCDRLNIAVLIFNPPQTKAEPLRLVRRLAGLVQDAMINEHSYFVAITPQMMGIPDDFYYDGVHQIFFGANQQSYFMGEFLAPLYQRMIEGNASILRLEKRKE